MRIAPEHQKDMADTLRDWIVMGYAIEPAITDEVRHRLGKCKCQQEKEPQLPL